MTLSPDEIRQDIAERRERVASLNRSAEQIGLLISYEEAVITALEGAAALIAREPPIEPISAEEDVVETPLGGQPDTGAAEPPSEEPAIEGDQTQAGENGDRSVGGVTISSRAIERVQGQRTVLRPARRPRPTPASKGGRRGGGVAYTQLAREIDVVDAGEEMLARADLLLRSVLLPSHVPVSEAFLVGAVGKLFECSESKALYITAEVLAVLIAQGRVRETRGGRWEPSPAERASAGLGVGQEYGGRTTRWPTASTTPGKPPRIVIEGGSFEGGKNR